MSARRNPETTRKPMDTEQLRKRLRARLERAGREVDVTQARIRAHDEACPSCNFDADTPAVCHERIAITSDLGAAIGRRKEAALVLREVSRGR